jgi:hypothetical protein
MTSIDHENGITGITQIAPNARDSLRHQALSSPKGPLRVKVLICEIGLLVI